MQKSQLIRDMRGISLNIREENILNLTSNLRKTKRYAIITWRRSKVKKFENCHCYREITAIRPSSVQKQKVPPI